MTAQYAQTYPYNGYSPQLNPPSQQYPQQQYPQQYYSQYPQQHPSQPQHPYPYHGPPSQQQAHPQQPHTHYQPDFHQQPPQPYPQVQQYGTAQPPSYQQPYVPHAQGQPTQSPSTPNPRSCYNCGRPDHFAQVCPEPKRAIPAGDIHRSAYHATKRLKMEHPSSVPYVPNHPSGHTISGPGGPPIPYGHPDYHTNPQRFPGPQPPATPASDASHFHGSWQYPHLPPQTAPYQQYPPHSSPPQPVHPPQQGYPHQGFPNPTAPPTPGFDERHGPLDHRASYGPLNQPQHQHINWRDSSFPGTSPTARSSSHTQDQIDHSNGSPVAASFRESRSMSPVLDDGPVELDESELEALDVPDFPTVADAIPAAPVAFPIPSNFVVADALAPYQPPEPESGGLVKSKYAKTDASLGENVRNSAFWDEAFAKDPAFTDLTYPPTRSSISVQSESRQDSDRDFRPSAVRKKSDQANKHSFQHVERSPTRRDRRTKNYHDAWSRDRSRSPVRFERRRSNNVRRRSISRSEHNHTVDVSPTQISPVDGNRHRIDTKPASPYGQRPPPPPHSAHRSSWANGNNDGSSDRASHGNGLGNGEVNGSNKSNSHQHTPANENVFSPPKLRTERSSLRKRESSEESDTPRRRQVDDVTPRHKRRQPQVADAYSRRW